MNTFLYMSSTYIHEVSINKSKALEGKQEKSVCQEKEINARSVSLKKMAHLLLHKCYIHIVFSVTETEKKFTSCCWFFFSFLILDVRQYLGFGQGYKSVNSPTM